MAGNNGSSTSYVSGQKVNDLTATEVTIDRSAVGSIEADTVTLERAAVRRMQARQATIEGSSLGYARIEQATIRKGFTGAVVARSVACDEVHTGILISPVVRGDVHTLLDIRSAIAVGLGIVLGRTILAGARGLGRRLIG
ncbi:MAG TPA: hypothetical protein VIK11_10485 [Tepidiformaceae bacterium]|jgi:hypothetical protein